MLKRYLLIIPLIFVGCAYRNPSPSPAVKLHTLRGEPTAWDRTYTKLAYQGAYGGNPPPYRLGPIFKPWQDPFDLIAYP